MCVLEGMIKFVLGLMYHYYNDCSLSLLVGTLTCQSSVICILKLTGH